VTAPAADCGRWQATQAATLSRNPVFSLALIIFLNFAPQFPIEAGAMRLCGRDIFVDCGAKNNLSACF